MRMRVLRRPIAFIRVRCSILTLLIKTVLCSILSLKHRFVVAYPTVHSNRIMELFVLFRPCIVTDKNVLVPKNENILLVYCTLFGCYMFRLSANFRELKTKYLTNLLLFKFLYIIYSVKIDNSSIERVEDFKYLGTTLADQNSIQEEIKSRLKLGNACYHSVQNLLSSWLLIKNLKIKIYRTIILPMVLLCV
jgi:hypothetical protein